MVITTSRTTARCVLNRAGIYARGRSQPHWRFQSTKHAQKYSVATHVAVGIASGIVVAAAGYAYYHYSGIKARVDSMHDIQQYYNEKHSVLAKDIPQNASEVLKYLRSVARSYVGIIPGATSLVDLWFDALDEVHAIHRETFDAIMDDIYKEVVEILKEAVEKQRGDEETARKLLDVLKRRGAELGQMSGKIAQDLVKKLNEKYPGVREKVGDTIGILRKIAEGSPEAKEILDETATQAQNLLSKSHVPDALNQAQKIVQENTTKLKRDIWREAEDAVRDVPELKKVLDQNKDALVNGGGDGAKGLESVEGVLVVAQDMAKSGYMDEKKATEFSNFVKSEVEDEKNVGGWVPSWAKSVTSINPHALFKSSEEKSRNDQHLDKYTLKDGTDETKKTVQKGEKESKEGARK